MSFLAAVGRTFLGFLQAIGRLTLFTAVSVSHTVTPPFYGGLLSGPDVGHRLLFSLAVWSA